MTEELKADSGGGVLGEGTPGTATPSRQLGVWGALSSPGGVRGFLIEIQPAAFISETSLSSQSLALVLTT